VFLSLTKFINITYGTVYIIVMKSYECKHIKIIIFI
jgi:hypothetical protein